MQTLIVIPARYGSTRFPGKPLAQIGGHSMLSRVAVRARAAARALEDAAAFVATDDDRIMAHCRELGVDAVMTDPDLPSGSDRALAAAETLGGNQRFVVNLQGDAPFTPVDYVVQIVAALREGRGDVATPTILLDWAGLDALREAKAATPFSGTTAVVGTDGRAFWFSKNVIPAIRKEQTRRAEGPLSPVRRHVGLYAFQIDVLRRFCAAGASSYEAIEGLEQLRILENGMSIVCVDVEAPALSTSGVDTTEDLARVERLIALHGDPDEGFFANA